MLNQSKIFLPVIVLSILAGCNDSSDTDSVADDVLNPGSVKLDVLRSNAVTYEDAAGGATHTDTYCPSGLLGKNGVDGTWSVTGNDIITNDTTNGTAYVYQTTDGTLVKGTTYTTVGGNKSFKVTNIVVFICL